MSNPKNVLETQQDALGAPNLTTLTYHIEAIRADQTGYLELGAIAGDPDDPRHKRYIQRWVYLDGTNSADLLQIVRQLAAQYGNVYSSRVLYQAPRRDKALALPTRALFLDDAPPGSYTYTVETSPQRMQAYILLDELISPDQAEQLGRRLTYQHHADPSGWDITQLVRVPGTLNTKARAGGRYTTAGKWVRGTGHQITLTERSGRAYSVAEITEAIQPTPMLPLDTLDPSSVAIWHGNIADLLTRDGYPRRWRNAQVPGWRVLRGELVPPSTSEARYIVIKSLVLHGYPDEEIAALALHLTDFNRMATKGSAWLYRDIARCTRKVRAELATQGKHIIINPTRPNRTHAPITLPRRAPARRGRACKGSPASYYSQLLDHATGDRVLWSLDQAATAMGVSIATIKRWEHALKAAGQIARVTVPTRTYSYVTILGQLKNPELAPAQPPEQVSSSATVHGVQTPTNENSSCTWEEHRGAGLPPVAPAVVESAASGDDQADELPVALPVALRADDQAAVPLPSVELLPGVELSGPCGAYAVVGGAAYVPAGAESWYAAICAVTMAQTPDQGDDQAAVTQLVAPLDAEPVAESLAPVPPVSEAVTTGRTAPRWARDLCAYGRRIARMSEVQLGRELGKWRAMEKQGAARWLTDRIAAVEREIDRREESAVSFPLPLDGTDGAGVPPPPCSSRAGAESGGGDRVQRRGWRSPVVRCHWEPVPFESRPTTAPPAWDGATLGDDPAALAAAHAAYTALRARYQAGGESDGTGV